MMVSMTDKDKREMRWPERFCIAAVRLILIIILMFLTSCSLLLTCSVYGGKEVTQYDGGRPLLQVALFLLLLGAAVWMKRRNIRPWKRLDDGAVYRRVMVFAAAACGAWIFLTLFWPNSDQRLAFESAQALLEGNYLPWAPWGFRYGSQAGIIGYAYTYPSQNGLILFMALFTAVFGGITPYMLQLVNVVFLFLGSVYLCRSFADAFSLEHMRGTSLLMVCFLPFTFYVTFVYGTVPGFFFSSMALYFLQRFLKTGRWATFGFSAVCICAAVLLKSNYLIVLTAMVICFAACGVFRKNLKLFGAAFLLVVLYMGSGRAMNLCLETITDEPVSKGAPMLAWVEMGLQEGRRAPGWYNGYNVRVFSENELDPERTLAAVKEDLKETVEGFIREPERARDFFLMKAASIWAEPSFQSVWIQEVKGDSWLFPELTKSLCREGGLLNRIYMAFFDCVQSLVYMGALLFFLMRRGRLSWEQLLFAVVFIGGFLFHMAWEAKGQYSVCYFILLIPYAVLGFSEAADRLGAAIAAGTSRPKI